MNAAPSTPTAIASDRFVVIALRDRTGVDVAAMSAMLATQ
jgi:hypothetical protein